MIDPLADISAASPPLEPPGDNDLSKILEVTPHNGFEHSKDINVWGTLVLTKGIPPNLKISWTNAEFSFFDEKQYFTSPIVESIKT